ncbi:MAG: DinB family protein [Bacteroidetes bacterium]|nr:DinB family protein [Bacteroidota bacterium]
MKFNIDETIEVLSRTPGVLKVLLNDLSHNWVHNNEGSETWSPYDVVGHLIHGEKTDWITRAKIIVDYGESRPFDPYDRFAQFEASKGKSIEELLEEFTALREQNIKTLREFKLTENDFRKTGKHPKFGKVTLEELLATWAVHDFNHIGQTARTMAKQYDAEVGPWKEYLPILHRRS